MQTWQSWAISEAEMPEMSWGNSNFGSLNWKIPYDDPGSCSGSDTGCVTVSMGALRSQVPHAQNGPCDSVPTLELTCLTLCQSVKRWTGHQCHFRGHLGPTCRYWETGPALRYAPALCCNDILSPLSLFLSFVSTLCSSHWPRILL